MKKLLQINVVINSGSTGKIAEDIGKLAIKNDWDSYIAYGRNDRPSASNKIRIGNNWDMRRHGIMTRLFDRHGLSSTRATKIFIAEIDKIKPDIIHLHNIHGYYLNYRVLFEYLETIDTPIVWTLHDCWTLTGHCAYFTYIKCNKWRDATGCFNCPQKRSYPASLFIERSKKNFEDKKKEFLSIRDRLTLVPVSNWLLDICSQSFFKDVPIKRIHNGVNTNVFKSISQGERDCVFKKYNINTPFLIVGVANIWDKRKGLDDFIKLKTLLPKEYSILLVGLSQKQISSLPQGIIGLTRTENISELSNIYASANVFFNPSMEETFGLTTIEALATGTPAIAYNSSASSEPVDLGTGFVVEPQDFSAILTHLKEIKKNGKQFYSATCRGYVMKCFEKEDRYNEYLQLYTEIIKKKQ